MSRKSVALSIAIRRLAGAGMTYDEIADFCKCSPATVGRYLHPETEQSYRLREEHGHTGDTRYLAGEQLQLFTLSD